MLARILFFPFFSLLVVASLVACTKDGAPVHVHENAVPAVSAGKDLSNHFEPVIDSVTSQNTLSKAVLDDLEQKQNPQLVLKALRGWVLNPQMIQDPKRNTHELSIRALDLYSQNLAKTTLQEQAHDWQTYRNLVLQDCQFDDDLIRNCRNLGYFYAPRTSSTTNVLLKLAAEEGDPTAAHRLVLLAFTYQNKTQNAALLNAFVRAALAERSQPDSRLHPLFTNALKLTLPRLAQGSELLEPSTMQALTQLSPWTDMQHDKDIKIPALRFLMTTSFAPAHAAFTEAVHGHLRAPTGFLTLQKQLQEFYPDLARTLKIQEPQIHESLLFILDRIYTRDLDPTDAAMYWKALQSQISPQDFEQNVFYYLQYRFLEIVQKSNGVFQNYFNNKVTVTSRLIDDALTEASKANKIFREFQDKARGIRDFSEVSRRSQDIQKVHDFIKGLPLSIKAMVVYPQMLMFGYYADKVGYKLSLSLLVKSEMVRSDSILQAWLYGELAPWMNYGHDLNPLSHIEILRSFEYAVALKVFESFDVSPLEVIDTLQRLLAQNQIRANQSLRSYIQSKYVGNNSWDETKRLCFSSSSAQRAVHEVSLFNMIQYPYLGHLYKDIDPSVAGLNTSNGKVVPQIFPFDNIILNALEEMRLKQPHLENALQFMLTAVQRSSWPQRHPELWQSNQNGLAQLRESKRLVLTELYKYKDTFIDCLFRVLGRNREVAEGVLKAEGLYLRTVHKRMSELRQSSNSKDLQAIEGTYLNKISSDKFLSSYVDFYVRAGGYYQNGIQTEFGSLPPLAPEILVVIPSNLKELPEYKQAAYSSIPYVEDPDEFVRLGLLTLTRAQDNLVWFENTVPRSSNLWTNLLQGLTLLRLFGPVQDDAGQVVSTPLSQILETPEKMIRLIHIENPDLHKRAGWEKTHNTFSIDGLFLSSINYKVRGLYDYILELYPKEFVAGTYSYEILNNKEGLKNSPPKTMIPLKREMSVFYRAMTNSNQYVIALQGDSLAPLYTQIKELWQRQRQDAEALMEMVQKSNPEAARPFQIDVHRPVQLMPAISQEALNKVKSQLNKYDDDTGFYFRDVSK